MQARCPGRFLACKLFKDKENFHERQLRRRRTEEPFQRQVGSGTGLFFHLRFSFPG
jgi:hypothetical protein